jgi:cytochrome d ubiquinol oxidase subunit II
VAGLILAIILAGLVLYVVLAGADFGAGFWQLVAGGGEAGARRREHAHDAMAPVWEANHVWLIFVLTVLWTGFPEVFASVASTLAVPLFVAALGIIFRGATYALRAGTASARETRVLDTTFAISSILTPFALGTMVGAIASRRVPVGNAQGDFVTSWLNGTSIAVGVLAVATSAYLAAVYLSADAHRDRDRELEDWFRGRALAGAVVTGGLGIGAAVVVHGDAHALYAELVSWPGLAGVIVSGLAGLATIALVWRRRFDLARASAALAVAGMIAGWALAQEPLLLPGLTVDQAAAANSTLVALLIAIVIGAILLFPSLGLLFRLLLGGRLGYGGGDAQAEAPGGEGPPRRPPILARGALALLVAGFGLVNVAEPEWAHAAGALCFVACLVLGVLAALPPEAMTPEDAGPS